MTRIGDPIPLGGSAWDQNRPNTMHSIGGRAKGSIRAAFYLAAETDIVPATPEMLEPQRPHTGGRCHEGNPDTCPPMHCVVYPTVRPRGSEPTSYVCPICARSFPSALSAYVHSQATVCNPPLRRN